MRNPRESALAEIESALDGLASVPEVEVLVRPRGNAERQVVFWLGPEVELRRAKREQLRLHLLRQTTWAEVLLAENGNRRRATVLQWPDPQGLPFPAEGVELLAVPVRYQTGEESEEKPHSKYSADCAEAVVSLLDESGRRAVGRMLEEALAGQFGGSTVRHTLSELVKQGKLTNSPRGDRYGTGYGLPCWQEGE